MGNILYRKVIPIRKKTLTPCLSAHLVEEEIITVDSSATAGKRQHLLKSFIHINGGVSAPQSLDPLQEGFPELWGKIEAIKSHQASPWRQANPMGFSELVRLIGEEVDYLPFAYLYLFITNQYNARHE